MTVFTDFLRDSGPTLIRLAGLLIVLACLPLVLLAAWKKIYPHTPLLVLLAVPVLLTFGLLIQPGLLPVILLIDVAVVVIGGIDLLTLPGRKTFQLDREETTRIASLGQNHRITLHVSNLGWRSQTAWLRDDIPQEFEPTPKEFVLRLAPRSRTTVHYELKASRRGAFQLKQLNLRVRSLLGLWQRFLVFPDETAIHVYPDMKQLAEYALLAR
ncbi:MAG: DUF58 domain-containing protein, partial [Pirellulaceae bacterium]|nr:DUF58 domain-containing protein [Pirellulaceae bacterium]